MAKFEDILKDQRPRGFFTAVALFLLGWGLVFILWTAGQVAITLYLGGADYILNGIKELSPEFEIRFAIGIFFFASVIGIGLTFLWKKFVENLPLITIFNATNHFRWKLFFLGAIIGPFLVIIGALASIYTDNNIFLLVEKRFETLGMVNFALLFLLWAFAIFFQASFEEILVRSQYMQYLRRAKIPLFFAAIITSFSFGMLHWLPDTPLMTNISIVTATGVMGLSFAYATWRTNGIELAMGAHVLNNLIIMAIVGQADNREIGNDALVSSLLYFVVFVGLLELFLKLFPDFLKEKGRDGGGADLIA